jgi:hypothetical protein
VARSFPDDQGTVISHQHSIPPSTAECEREKFPWKDMIISPVIALVAQPTNLHAAAAAAPERLLLRTSAERKKPHDLHTPHVARQRMKTPK